MKITRRLCCPLIFVLCTISAGPGYARPVAADDPIIILPDEAGCIVGVPCPPPADPPVPIVTVKVQVPACVDADKNLEYRICVENVSPAQALNVVVLDKLPANAKFVRASPMPHRIGPELEWQLGTLRGHACQEITLVLEPINNEDVFTCVRVQFEHGVCVCSRRTSSPPSEKTPGKEKAPDNIIPKESTTKEPPLAGGSKLNLNVKGPETKNVNETASYVITLTNVGTAPARNVVLISDLDKKLTVVRASDNGIMTKPFDGKVAWHLVNLAAKESRSVELMVRASQAGVVCFQTRALYDEDPEQFTTTEKKCTTFTGGVGALLIEMYDREDPIPVNGTTSYPIVILNQGTAPVNNVRIWAVIPDGMQLLDAKGAQYQMQGKTLLFEPLPTLAPGEQKVYEVFAKALKAGDMIFRVQMTADDQAGPVTEEERTTVYSEDVPPTLNQSFRRPLRRLGPD